MAAKMLSFDAEARKSLLAGVTKLSRAVKATLGPTRQKRGDRQGMGALRPSPRMASPSPRKSNSRTSTKTSAPSWSKKPPARPAMSPATERPPPPFWPRRFSRKDIAIWPPGLMRWPWPAASARPSKPSSKISRNNPSPSAARPTSPTSPPSPPTTTARSATSWPTPSSASARTASSPSKKARAWKPTSMSSRECSSTAAICRPISSPIPMK